MSDESARAAPVAVMIAATATAAKNLFFISVSKP
jgi:hypothetical protein